MTFYQSPAVRDAARLNSIGIESDGLGDTTYATGAESGAEFEVYRTPTSGWGVVGHGIIGNFPALVKFLRSN